MDAEHESDLRILGVDHVGVAVADLDEAVAFYRDVLGLRAVHREENSGQDVVEVMLAEHPPVGRRRRRTEIQLLAPLSAESLRRFLDRSGPGSSTSPTPCATSATLREFCKERGFGCSMIQPGLVPAAPGSTSSTPRMPVVY